VELPDPPTSTPGHPVANLFDTEYDDHDDPPANSDDYYFDASVTYIDDHLDLDHIDHGATALSSAAVRTRPSAVISVMVAAASLSNAPGGVAQLVERYVRNVEAVGSTPITSTQVNGTIGAMK
jgi:hypothetical protein